MYHGLVPLPLPPLEQQWSDEVHYLHSLWRQGPPSNPNPKPIPTPKPASPISTFLAPSTSTSFKKVEKKKVLKKKKKKQAQDSDPPPIVDAQWQSQPVQNPQPETGWPDPAPKPELVITPEEQEKYAAIQLQQKNLKACHDFFSRNKSESDKEDGKDEERDQMEDEEEEKAREAEETEFFLGIFKEDNELRSYYEKNNESGEFCCLVCGGAGRRVGKRYKNCVALVQHSITISKTKEKTAHRAFGKAICEVLGWDINRLPSIVLSMDDPLGGRLVHADTQENHRNVEAAATNADDVSAEEAEFFLGIFNEHNELRSYYEKNMESGEFCCLVCGGFKKKVGKKVGKRFKNCVALVQHSISQTKRKSAHRAFGEAICQVLGWNINQLPKIFDRHLVKADTQESGQNVQAAASNADNAGSDQNENTANKVVESVEPKNGDQILVNDEETRYEDDVGENTNDGVGQIEIDADELYKDLD